MVAVVGFDDFGQPLTLLKITMPQTARKRQAKIRTIAPL
jgi:hypothetical protein